MFNFLLKEVRLLTWKIIEATPPLHHAVIDAKIPNMRRLIELGADILSECNHRYSAVHLASKTGHTEAVQVRLEHGANVTKAYYFIGSPLTSAARNGHLEIVQLLLESCGRLNKQGAFMVGFLYIVPSKEVI